MEDFPEDLMHCPGLTIPESGTVPLVDGTEVDAPLVRTIMNMLWYMGTACPDLLFAARFASLGRPLDAFPPQILEDFARTKLLVDGVMDERVQNILRCALIENGPYLAIRSPLLADLVPAPGSKPH